MPLWASRLIRVHWGHSALMRLSCKDQIDYASKGYLIVEELKFFLGSVSLILKFASLTPNLD